MKFTALGESLMTNIALEKGEKGVQNFGLSKIHLRVGLYKKLIKMHWYIIYNNTVPLLNIMKALIFYPVYNFKNF